MKVNTPVVYITLVSMTYGWSVVSVCINGSFVFDKNTLQFDSIAAVIYYHYSYKIDVVNVCDQKALE